MRVSTVKITETETGFVPGPQKDSKEMIRRDIRIRRGNSTSALLNSKYHAPTTIADRKHHRAATSKKEIMRQLVSGTGITLF